MSTSAALPHLNGSCSVVPAEVQREADFLKSLLQVRDEVFTGKHPRIRLPAKVLEQVAPRPPQTAPPSRPTTNGTPNGVASSHLFPPRPESSLQQFPSPNEFASPAAHGSRPFSAKPASASSGIDPVLLTKSDHLIKAELKLKRQQIERILKDQFDKRGRANDEEREALDVESLLAEAQRLVKPVSGLRVSTANSDAAESFDENSYYSSKADSWSSEEVDRSQNNNADVAEPLTLQGKRATIEAQLTATKPNQAKHIEPTVIDLDEEPYEPADDIEIYEPEPARVHDEADESDYSPPPAELGPGDQRRGRGPESYGGVNGSSGQQSPAGLPPPIQNNRKRKREDKREEKRRQQANKRVIRSPEPYIKEEPQSPPPFASLHDPPSGKRRALQPPSSDVEVLPGREGSRTQPVYYREQEPSARTPRQFEEPLSPGIARVPQRRLEHDNQDLRRIASLQHARRPYSPAGGDLYAAPEPRHIRAASHAFAERPLEHPVYREASARPSGAPRYLERSPPHEYLSRAQSPMMMAPPPRRIVVDQYGNKYYAAPADARESVAPPIRRMEADPYYERAVTREPAMRASTRAELYEEDDIQRMLPPPPRRFVEATDVDMIEARPYRREASHRPVEMEYRPQEVLERRPVPQYEDMGPPREYMPARAYSVRPEVLRREVPEGYVRHESVQPGHVRVAAPRYREVSVVHQEPYEDRRYAFATPQSRRYVEDGASERPVEAAQDPYSAAEARRVSYRY
ncbi:hypothetical protein K458DRAFT_418255 [Lentithecium fluviatile CBS 122367]|uniref:Uncharacterized protein n=1 Tax=Lentithecium fluviatile CBS 122367 TaxID=1168545 RepID=A0A6G1J179_9PLEO|nr:hypothetical protein K458DRAFT_418255 [Lentithecium fluviatile CBS 122367]